MSAGNSPFWFPWGPRGLCPRCCLQVDQLAAEVAQLRNANGAGVLASEEQLRALQAQYEDLLG